MLASDSVTSAANAASNSELTSDAVTNDNVLGAAAIATSKIENTAAVLNANRTQTFSSDALVIDGLNDRIGVNKSGPAHAVDVVGDTNITGDSVTELEYFYFDNFSSGRTVNMIVDLVMRSA